MNVANRCAGCRNLISTSVSFIHALDKDWHSGCFVCSVCRDPLKSFYNHAGSLLCEKHYLASLPTCRTCKTTLIGNYRERNGVCYCDDHYWDAYGIQCAACSMIIKGNGITISASNKVVHPECFICAGSCGRSIGSNTYYMINDLPYCVSDYEARFQYNCSRCHEIIMGDLIIVGEKAFHAEHFTCSICSLLIADRDNCVLMDGVIRCSNCANKEHCEESYSSGSDDENMKITLNNLSISQKAKQSSKDHVGETLKPARDRTHASRHYSLASFMGLVQLASKQDTNNNSDVHTGVDLEDNNNMSHRRVSSAQQVLVDTDLGLSNVHHNKFTVDPNDTDHLIELTCSPVTAYNNMDIITLSATRPLYNENSEAYSDSDENEGYMKTIHRKGLSRKHSDANVCYANVDLRKMDDASCSDIDEYMSVKCETLVHSNSMPSMSRMIDSSSLSEEPRYEHLKDPHYFGLSTGSDGPDYTPLCCQQCKKKTAGSQGDYSSLFCPACKEKRDTEVKSSDQDSDTNFSVDETVSTPVSDNIRKSRRRADSSRQRVLGLFKKTFRKSSRSLSEQMEKDYSCVNENMNEQTDINKSEMEMEKLEKKEIIIGGTINNLVDHLAKDEMLQNLLSRFKTTKHEPRKKYSNSASSNHIEHYTSFLIEWILLFYSIDFQLSSPRFNQLERIMETMAKNGWSAERVRVEEAINTARSRTSQFSRVQDPLIKCGKDPLSDLVFTKHTTLASQITIEEVKYFRSVGSEEYITYLGWVNSPVYEKRSHLPDYIQWFNNLSAWTTSVVCLHRSLERRVEILEKLIKTARELRRLRNYNSLFAVVSGLSHPCVARLKITWGTVNKRYVDLLDSLSALMNPIHNFNEYRLSLRSAVVGVPVTCIALKDMIFLNEMPRHFPNGLCNFRKLRQVVAQIESLHNCVPKYAYKGLNSDIKASILISQIPSLILTPAMITARSKVLEPRQHSSDYVKGSIIVLPQSLTSSGDMDGQSKDNISTLSRRNSNYATRETSRIVSSRSLPHE